MKKNFFKFTVFILMAFFTSNVVAQNEAGDKEIGADFILGIGSGDLAPGTFFGGGIKGRWTLVDNFRLEAVASYMVASETYEYEEYGMSFSHDESYGMIDISVNAHYLFGLGDAFFLYPIAGLGLVAPVETGETEGTATSFALNVGAGAQYMFSENWGANLEAKYKIQTGDAFNYIALSLGAVYKF